MAVVKVIFDRGLPARTFQTYKWIAIGAVIYCLWAVLGGDQTTVVYAMVALLASVPLYPFFIRSMEAASERKRTGVSSPDAARSPGSDQAAVGGKAPPAVEPQRA